MTDAIMKSQQTHDREIVESMTDGRSSLSESLEYDMKDDQRMKFCRVCGDKALSINFNVVTCESCKAFFRRNALKPKAFRCPFNGSCEINVVSRKFCKKCRLRKCFEVGMMKEWIMSDEARLKKRELINANREKRRTIIMATAAKHGLDEDSDRELTGKVEKIKADSFVDGRLATKRPHDDISGHDYIPIQCDQLITVRKSSLIELISLCRSPPYDDLDSKIHMFVERYAIRTDALCGVSQDMVQKANDKQTLSENACDCGVCVRYGSMKVPRHNMLASLTVPAAGVQLPTLNATANRIEDKAPNMLSFLAPSLGKHYHAVDYPLTTGIQNMGQRPALPNEPSPWTESTISMPAIPLEISPNLYDMVHTNIGIQHTQPYSCPLPIKLVDDTKVDTGTSMNDRYGEAGDNSESVIGIGNTTNVNLTKLRELLEAKTFLLNDLETQGHGIKQKRNDSLDSKLRQSTMGFFQQIPAFERLPEADKISLFTANYQAISILRQVMQCGLPHEKLSEMSTNEKTFEMIEAWEKYARIIPKVWRDDECIMLILMAISMFDYNECQLIHGNDIEENQRLYVDLLRQYLECIYKLGEVQSAHDVLLAILFDIRSQKTKIL